MNLKECWALVDMSEKTRKHCMILENCCYDWFEMNTLNMAQQGVFGEVIRAQGAYIHNLSPFWNHYWKNGEGDKLGWRLDYNMKHRGDVYATHGLGPVAQAFDIHLTVGGTNQRGGKGGGKISNIRRAGVRFFTDRVA